MIKRCTLLFFLLFCTLHADIFLQKNSIYDPDRNVSGWVMSEKLDGIRAYWDGKSLTTKQGNPIYAPAWFTDALPPFPLDGELWSKRGDFETIQSIVLDHTPSQEWQKIGYHIFEVPTADGNFYARLSKIENWLKTHPVTHLHVIEQIEIQNSQAIQLFLKNVIDKSGEGVMLKNPHPSFEKLTKNDLLKLKQINDMEGVVIDINPGKGKFEGLMGSLTIQLDNNITFNLGTGFDLKVRQNPPPVGTVVTFGYRGFTKNKKPKFPSFLRIRKDLNGE